MLCPLLSVCACMRACRVSFFVVVVVFSSSFFFFFFLMLAHCHLGGERVVKHVVEN